MTDRLPKTALWVPCGDVFLRTIKREDASDRWAEWLADPWTIATLNPPRAPLTRKDIADYIRAFDQRERLLLGIFARGSRRHVGVIRVDIDAARREAFVSALIGEAEFRNSGATTVVFGALLDHLFGTLKLTRIAASVLDRNRLTQRYLEKLGWTRVGPADTALDHGSGEALGVVNLAYDAARYRAFRASPTGRRLERRLAAAQYRFQNRN